MLTAKPPDRYTESLINTKKKIPTETFYLTKLKLLLTNVRNEREI